MAKHTNPTGARKISRTLDHVEHFTYVNAHAPYNFIPLADETYLNELKQLPDHDRYAEDRKTGWLDYTIETKSPTYIRGAILREIYETLPDGSLDDDQKEKIAPFFFQDQDDKVGKYPRPSIPGSSLRGMIRSILEIILQARPRWVDGHNKITYREIAKPQDPLNRPYKNIIGMTTGTGLQQLGANVRAGYLIKSGDGWKVHPAQALANAGLGGRLSFHQLTVRHPNQASETNQLASQIKAAAEQQGLPYWDLLDKNHQPSCVPVSYKTNSARDAVGFDVPGKPSQQGWKEGCVVCSGNMSIKGQNVRTKRAKYVLVPEKDPQAAPIEIWDEAVKEYLASMTDFVKDELSAWSDNQGVLSDGKPVFYVTSTIKDKDGNPRQVVRHFGHNPNFRVAAIPEGRIKAASPRDFIPADLLAGSEPDWVESIFGWVQEDGDKQKGERAGRVFFENAHYPGKEDVWYSQTPLTLEILSSPKPTTFQHYLVQDRDNGHDPDNLPGLATYCSKPETTAIRGYKYYWVRGNNRSPEYRGTPEEKRNPESQLTRVLPVKKNVSFSGRVYFENLSPEELGALYWALSLPGEQGKTYCHRLGMGKPLGMGAVQIKDIRLTLTNREERYDHLFSKVKQGSPVGVRTWNTGALESSPANFITELEDYLGYQLNSDQRVRTLLLMMEERQGDDQWIRLTDYMKIKDRMTLKSNTGAVINQEMNVYSVRPVLPTPEEVVRWHKDGAPLNEAAIPRVQTPIGDAGKSATFGTHKTNTIEAIQPPPVNRPITNPTDLRGVFQGFTPGSASGIILTDDGKNILIFRDARGANLLKDQAGKRVLIKKTRIRAGDVLEAKDVQVDER